MQGNRLCRMVLGALLAVPAAAQMSGMNHQNFNRAGRYLMNMSSGTAMNPYSWQMPMLMTQRRNLEPHVHGAGIPGGHAAKRSARRRQILLRQLVHGLGAALRGQRQPGADGDGQPGSGDGHQPAVSAAISNRRDRLRTAAGGRAASPRFPDGPERSVCAARSTPTPCCSSTTRRWAIRHSDRWRSRTAPRHSSSRRPRWGITGRIPPTSPTMSATVAVRHKWLRLEASGFYGTEPDENRWNIDWGRMNSYSAPVFRGAERELAGAGFRRPIWRGRSARRRATWCAPRRRCNTRARWIAAHRGPPA